MDIAIENTGSLSRKMSVTVPASEIDQLASERYAHIQKTVKMPGFRPGHVPMDVVKQKYSESVMQEITQQVVSSSLGKALQEKDVRPAGQPKMEEMAAVEAGKDFSYTVSFDIYPEIKPAGLEGIKLTRATSEPDDTMIEDVLKRMSSVRKEYARKDAAAEMGDRVMMNAQGFKKGEDAPFEGGTLKDFQIELGSNQLIPGFEEELVGLKAGDKKEFDINFPKEYHSEELKGKPAVFKVEIQRVESVADATLDDKFAQSFGAENMDDLKKRVSEQVANDLQHASHQRLKRELFDALDTKNQFDVPEALSDAEFNAIWQAQQNDMMQRGVSFDDLDKSEDELRTEYRDLAKRRVRLGLLLAEIGKTQDIRVDAKDIQAEIDRIAEANGDQAQQVRQYFADPQRHNEIAGPLFEKKVTDWLIEKAEVKDKKVKPEELMEELA